MSSGLVTGARGPVRVRQYRRRARSRTLVAVEEIPHPRTPEGRMATTPMTTMAATTMPPTTTDEADPTGPAHPAHPDRPARPWTPVLRRWPTLLAVGMTVASLGGGDVADTVAGYGEALVLLPILYLVVGKLERRSASWPVLIAGFALIAALRLFDVVDPSLVLVGVAAATLAWAAADHVAGHAVHEPRVLAAQAVGVVAFSALAVAGLAADPEIGRWLVAAGWFLHGVWDFVHLRLDRVVSRSYAEWCGVVDVLVAVQLAFLL